MKSYHLSFRNVAKSHTINTRPHKGFCEFSVRSMSLQQLAYVFVSLPRCVFGAWLVHDVLFVTHSSSLPPSGSDEDNTSPTLRPAMSH